jgi:hypothetical protein
VSLDTNPEPVTLTVNPTPPEEGERTIVGPDVTVKIAVAESPLLAFTVIVYD